MQGGRKLLRRAPHPGDVAATPAQRQAERGPHVAAAGNQDPRRIAAFEPVGSKPWKVQMRASQDRAMRARTAPQSSRATSTGSCMDFSPVWRGAGQASGRSVAPGLAGLGCGRGGVQDAGGALGDAPAPCRRAGPSWRSARGFKVNVSTPHGRGRQEQMNTADSTTVFDSARTWSPSRRRTRLSRRRTRAANSSADAFPPRPRRSASPAVALPARRGHVARAGGFRCNPGFPASTRTDVHGP